MSRSQLSALVVAALFLAGCREATTPALAPGPGDTKSSSDSDVASVRAFLADAEKKFNTNDPDIFMPIFTDDAVIMSQGSPDIKGHDAIRAGYVDALKQVGMELTFASGEVQVLGDLAYEQGTYTVKMLDKASHQVVQEIKNRHIHILRRHPDGTWKTWRMMTNSAEPAVPAK